MSNSNATSSRRRGIVVILAIVVVLLIVLSAFVWPGWAMRHNASQSAQATTQTTQSQQRPEKPAIDAVALPQDATDLMKALPDAVLNFARTKVEASTEWQDMSPLEEYTVTYSTGEKGHDITMSVAQWSDASAAAKLYEQLSTTDKASNGKLLAHGSVKVSGAQTGLYEVYELPVADESAADESTAGTDKQDTKSENTTSSDKSSSTDGAADNKTSKKSDSQKSSGKAVAVWQNDTVVFQITGAKEDVVDFYAKFPM